MANMIQSIDGAFAVEGRSGGLGTPADHLMFHTLRAASDAILVAAGTARAEGYRRPSTADDDLARRRGAAGLSPAPALYLVSRVLDLPATMPLRAGAGAPPVVMYPEGDGSQGVDDTGLELRGIPGADAGGVDLAAAVRSIAADGHQLVLCEGGPTLLGELNRQGLLDELFVSYSPVFAGGPSLGILGRHPQPANRLTLRCLHEADDMLLADYLVGAPEAPS